MKFLFWFTLAIVLLQIIFKIIIKKDFFNISTYIALGIYLPLILYFQNWSRLIDTKVSPKFYFLFICLNLGLFFTNIVIKKNINFKLFDIKIKRRGRVLIVCNIVFLSLSIFKNYMLSGYVLPALRGIDIHAVSMPGISYIVDSLFTIILANFLYWYKTKRKVYLGWIILLLVFPVIGTSDRMSVVVTLIQILSFGLFVYINDKKYKLNKKAFFSSKRQKIVLVLSLIISLIFMVALTEYRWGGYGKIEVSYSDSILYTGPDMLEDYISVYYGYFPLSFNNLNVNIKISDTKPNFVGLYSFKGLYFGVFRLHNLFNLNPYEPKRGSYVSAGSATVATGFYDFYYDYDMLLFIPIFIGLLIYITLDRRVKAKNATIGSYALYFAWVPLWFFMSFQNMIFSSTIIIRAGILYTFVNYFFILDKTNIQLSKKGDTRASML